jgi:hypothetical protein
MGTVTKPLNAMCKYYDTVLNIPACGRRGHAAPRKTRMCHSAAHPTLRKTQAQRSVSTNSSKTPDDDQGRSKHVVDNVALK